MPETLELVEIEPGRYRFSRPQTAPARSALPCPHIISDIMAPTEQVDGRFYESKSQFRAVGRANNLVEVGNEKPKPRVVRSTEQQFVKRQRRDAIGRAVSRYKAGERIHT